MHDHRGQAAIMGYEHRRGRIVRLNVERRIFRHPGTYRIQWMMMLFPTTLFFEILLRSIGSRHWGGYLSVLPSTALLESLGGVRECFPTPKAPSKEPCALPKFVKEHRLATVRFPALDCEKLLAGNRGRRMKNDESTSRPPC